MVWIKAFIVIFFAYSSYSYSNELNADEEMYFNFADLNNDGVISLTEIDQTLNLLFQIIDLNQDDNISKNEINELKNILESLK